MLFRTDTSLMKGHVRCLSRVDGTWVFNVSLKNDTADKSSESLLWGVMSVLIQEEQCHLQNP